MTQPLQYHYYLHANKPWQKYMLLVRSPSWENLYTKNLTEKENGRTTKLSVGNVHIYVQERSERKVFLNKHYTKIETSCVQISIGSWVSSPFGFGEILNWLLRYNLAFRSLCHNLIFCGRIHFGCCLDCCRSMHLHCSSSRSIQNANCRRDLTCCCRGLTLTISGN